MAKVTLAQILDAIESTLAAAVEVAVSQSYDELTESIPDKKLLQVYPEEGSQDPGGNTDRTTFRAGVRQTNIVVLADYYAQQRAHMGEDMKQLVAGIDAITDILEAQDTKPYFGLEGIKAFSWSWRRAIIEYASVNYVAARFTINVRVF